jgi:hypothetical protein
MSRGDREGQQSSTALETRRGESDVFSYRCSGCGKQHNKNHPFADDFETKCIRCGRAFTVSRDMIHESSDTGAAGGLEHAIINRAEGNGASRPKSNHAITTEAVAKQPAPEAGITVQLPGEGPDGKQAGSSRKEKRLVNPAEEISEEAADALDAIPPAESEETDGERGAGPGGKKPKKKGKKPEKPAGSEKADAPSKPGAGKPAPQWDKEKKKRTLILGGVIAAVFALGVGGYFAFGKSKKKPVARKTTPAPQPQPQPAPPPKEKVTPPPAKPKARESQYWLSAPRLAAEVAADPAAADSRYKDAVLQVSGLFDRIETVKIAPPKSPPAKAPAATEPAAKGPAAKGAPAPPPPPTSLAFAVFQTAKGKVSCDLASSLVPDVSRLKVMTRGAFFTVQGVYSQGGILRQCQVQAPSAPVDVKYKGKVIELTGPIGALAMMGPRGEFPTILFDRETNGHLEVQCLFKEDDLATVNKYPPGVVVTIQGACSGRLTDPGKKGVQLDNCRIVTTSAPTPPIPRIDVFNFCREYEEDLRPYFLPARGLEDQLATPLTVTGLSKEWKANPKSLDKYLYRVITVSGRLDRMNSGQVILKSTETDQPLKVTGRFTKGTFGNLESRSDFQLRGFCSQIGQQVQLENCDVESSFLKTATPRLTTDYLPHTPGTNLVYDLAVYPQRKGLSPYVYRQVWRQQGQGVTQVIRTHTARWRRDLSLFTKPPRDWTAKHPFKIDKRVLPESGMIHQIVGGIVAFGSRGSMAPAVKSGVKVGESWEWIRTASKHQYTLVRFDTYRGRPAAVIKEVVATPLSMTQQNEIEHIYVRNLGEVERREWVRDALGELKLVMEVKMFLAEDAPIRPAKDLKGTTGNNPGKESTPEKNAKDKKPALGASAAPLKDQ